MCGAARGLPVRVNSSSNRVYQRLPATLPILSMLIPSKPPVKIVFSSRSAEATERRLTRSPLALPKIAVDSRPIRW